MGDRPGDRRDHQSAQIMSSPQNFKDLIGIFLGLINATMPVLISLAMLVFLWGLVKFISKASSEKAHEDGINLMKWGLVGLFVMVSYMGIVAFFYRDFEFTRAFPGRSGTGRFLPQNKI
jgi:hypothetical protein